MEWLRCNECYIMMERTTRNFSITQCGHLFCDVCLSKGARKCHVCGTADFRSLPLTRPPKLETTMNYFSSSTDIAQQLKKAIDFHEEQLMISLRGFKELCKKYENGKRKYAELAKDIEKGTFRYKELSKRLEEVNTSIRAYEGGPTEGQRDIPAEAKKVQTIDGVISTITRSQVVCDTTQRGYGTRDSRAETSGCVGATTRYVHVPAGSRKSCSMSADVSTTKSTPQSMLQSTPKYPYNPNPAFTDASRASSASGSHSSRSTLTTCATPATVRHGDFVVPTVQRVPISVATARRKARTFPRISHPKTSHNL